METALHLDLLARGVGDRSVLSGCISEQNNPTCPVGRQSSFQWCLKRGEPLSLVVWARPANRGRGTSTFKGGASEAEDNKREAWFLHALRESLPRNMKTEWDNNGTSWKSGSMIGD